jgi:hypothetical protein
MAVLVVAVGQGRLLAQEAQGILQALHHHREITEAMGVVLLSLVAVVEPVVLVNPEVRSHPALVELVEQE